MPFENESELARKLVEDWHLNVRDRKLIPTEGIAASTLIAAIRDIIAEESRYPKDWSPDSFFDGILIVPSEQGFILHECRETGVGRYTYVGESRVDTLEEAVKRFVAAVLSPDQIDGIAIDWNR